MQLRTFTARDMKAALALVRAEMGAEAVIVASERGRNGVMVRAAADQPDIEPEPPKLIAALEPAALLSFESRCREGLMRRVRADQSAAAAEPLGFNRAKLLTILGRHRLADALSHALAEAAEKTALTDMTLALASALDKRMEIAPLDLNKTTGILLAGMPGAGKSAVAAKIAAHAKLCGRDVRLIAADATGAGAIARLESFAGHIGAKFAVAETADTWLEEFSKAEQEKTLAVIDTAGIDPRNAKVRTAFSALGKLSGVTKLGVVSAMGDAEETADIADGLRQLGAHGLIVSGLDLAQRLGALASAATQNVPLAHVTRSPFVAAGLETMTPLSLARALIAADADRRSAQ
jgi:flagellar biosynthesis protein FlhF